MGAAAKSETHNAPAVVVFGLDDKGKPHASAFDVSEAKLAQKAAGLMGMQVLRPKTADQRALAAKLPRGRIFASGRGFVPFVGAGLYAAPTGSPGAAEGTSNGRGGQGGGNGGPRAPKSPADIGVGSLVLAHDEVNGGWYESLVLRVDGDDLMTLKWRDWPKNPVFARRRSQLALLPPETVSL
jgi:hypothetical protein